MKNLTTVIVMAMILSSCANFKLAEKSDFGLHKNNGSNSVAIIKKSEKIILNNIVLSKDKLSGNLFQRMLQILALRDSLLTQFQVVLEVDSIYDVKNWSSESEPWSLAPWTDKDTSYAMTLVTMLYLSQSAKTRIIIIATDKNLVLGLGNNEDKILVRKLTSDGLAVMLIETLTNAILRDLYKSKPDPNSRQI